MKHCQSSKLWIILGLIPVFALTSCAGPQNKTEQGALIGAGAGAATGALLGQAIGRDTKSTLIGAAAGALVGGAAGGAIGNYMDRQEQEMRQALAATEAANVQRTQDVLAVTFKSDVLFDFNSSTLKPGAHSELDRVAQVLNRYPQTRITVEGHTDSVGSLQYNQRLSERRALSVKEALVSRGVSPDRIETIGYGETRPIASNDSEAGRQLNRRVTILITPVQG
ncbi:OmpA family protein [Desulfosoma caldarium]|uniref:Outer membrane protein OmpA-like peptidoglycan-associated protein n=1 Tax=Desulfosoma caldarium TaxID=610254 RepID=A0A3N1UNE1_9BACT|nr:OmpA family protein [Desulfosoma caldarium]ROQ90240.1 outer membrane protein OmpA-like peptidoglycan-associated protein [Desulfosoma caldarium]